MEVLGYVHLRDLGKPVPEIVDGVEKEFQALSIQDVPGEALSIFGKGGPRCDQFIGYGTDELQGGVGSEASLTTSGFADECYQILIIIQMRSTVKSYIRNEIFVRQGPRPVRVRQSQQGRVHMKKNQAIGIFKVAPERSSVTFRLSLPGQEELVTTIKLHEDELLFVSGSVTVKIEITSDTPELIWDGYSSVPVGMDILNTDVLDFAKL